MSSLKKKFELKNHNILITGGAGFLSKYFAEAVYEMGAKPILLDINKDRLKQNINFLKKRNIRAYSEVIDLTNQSSVITVIQKINKKFGTINTLINAAAFAMSNFKKDENFFRNFENYKLSDWQKSIDVNLTGTYLITQTVGKLMKRNKKGNIINIASDVGIISPDHRIYKADKSIGYKGVNFNTPLSYSVSKSGILAFTRFLATYWAEHGIRVNSISPSGVYNKQDPKFVKVLSSRIPLNRMARPEELKGPLVFLCSEASSYITGANLIVDGGKTAW
ncbi:MAG: short-chain dehydrogenase [Spirochaetales bacterium]|nr:short-chain dehydrogenase [Spirochaetales bacterium]